MGVAHTVMMDMIEQVKQSGATPDTFFDHLSDLFADRMRYDEEFRTIADRIYQELVAEGVTPEVVKNVRIVESMAEGVITGFVKALILHKTQGQSNVEEFLVAPKLPQD